MEQKSAKNAKERQMLFEQKTAKDAKKMQIEIRI